MLRGALLFFCSLFSVLQAESVNLQERLNQAQPGSYIVFQQNKTFTFLHVFDRDERSVTLEEVSIPEDLFRRRKTGWKEWFESGAWGSSAWIMSRVNLMSGQVEAAYSFKQESWLNVSEIDHFMTTLLHLPFQEVPEKNRRKQGVAPKSGKDERPLWNPKVVVNGVLVPNVPFGAWEARWPKDGSELSNRLIEIYLPLQTETPSPYPTFFPYWIEVEGRVNSIRMRVVDSGLYAKSPRTGLPS